MSEYMRWSGSRHTGLLVNTLDTQAFAMAAPSAGNVLLLNICSTSHAKFCSHVTIDENRADDSHRETEIYILKLLTWCPLCKTCVSFCHTKLLGRSCLLFIVPFFHQSVSLMCVGKSCEVWTGQQERPAQQCRSHACLWGTCTK